MCLGIYHIHATCHHAKKFDVVESCHSSFPSTACTNLTTLHVITIHAPALCIACYRRKEAMIDAEYEKIKRDLESEIARVDEWFAKEGGLIDERGSGLLDGYRDECEDDIRQAKAARDVGIRLFRREQGVWGDG